MPGTYRTWSLLAIAIFCIVALWLGGGASFLATKRDHADITYPAAAHPKAVAQDRPKRVAIVGAGASGTAAAWFLSRAGKVMSDRLGGKQVLGEIVVFEQEGRVGGRTMTVHPHGDERLRPQELGASIFVTANRHLQKAAKACPPQSPSPVWTDKTQRFGLKVIDPDFGDAGIGIWDGREFLYTTSTEKGRWSSYWDTISAVRRYGALSPWRTNRAVKALLKKFGDLYNPAFLAKRGVVDSIDAFGQTVGLGKDLTTRHGTDWAKMVGLGDKWVNEIIGSSTRVNYARNVNDIHALGAGVSMATGGASAVDVGNWQIFKGMLDESKATVHLHTLVSDIRSVGTGSAPRFEIDTNTTDLADDAFDAVLFAAPWHLSPVSKSIAADFAEAIPKQPYVHLHVTYLTTTRTSPDPRFFDLPAGSKVPNTILTSSTALATELNSITWHGETSPGSGEYAVKIFSMDRLSEDFLYRLLGGETPSWVLRKEWDSYPALGPISSFAPVEPIKGFHYLGAMEPWISTMETQTLSGREAVARLVDEWWGLGMGECGGGADAWDWACDD